MAGTFNLLGQQTLQTQHVLDVVCGRSFTEDGLQRQGTFAYTFCGSIGHVLQLLQTVIGPSPIPAGLQADVCHVERRETYAYDIRVTDVDIRWKMRGGRAVHKSYCVSCVSRLSHDSRFKNVARQHSSVLSEVIIVCYFLPLCVEKICLCRLESNYCN